MEENVKMEVGREQIGADYIIESRSIFATKKKLNSSWEIYPAEQAPRVPEYIIHGIAVLRGRGSSSHALRTSASA